MKADTTPIQPQPCPYCSNILDTAGRLDNRTPAGPPQPGEFLMCTNCGQPSVWSEGPFGTGLRRATAEERAEFAVDHGLRMDCFGDSGAPLTTRPAPGT